MLRGRYILAAVTLWILSVHVTAQVGKQEFCNFEKQLFKTYHIKSADTSMLKYDVKCYQLDLELSNQNANIKGSATITSQVIAASLTEFVLELDNKLIVDSVLSDSEIIPFLHENDLLKAVLAEIPDSGSFLNIQVYYHGQALEEGLFNRSDQTYGNMVTWTLSEPLSAKFWYPAKQVLEDKADSVKISITTEQGLRAGSNGILERIDTLEGGQIRFHWVSHHPIAYYLLSVALSDYQEYNVYTQPTGRSDSLLIQNYIYDHPDYLLQNKQAIDRTANLVNLFSDLFTLYPFYNEKYGHCLTPAGPYMEHQTMSSMRDFNYRIVAHELAHQWFGDHVTCGTWQDIWINEGFASYAEYLGFEQLGLDMEARAWLDDAHTWALNEPEGSVYIPFEELWLPGRLFNYSLTYRKGAAIIHMLRFEIQNDMLFFDILRQFQTSFKDDVATGMDFEALVESMSQTDYSYFFNQWYFGKGYPIYDFIWGQEQDTLWIRSMQTTSSSETTLFRMPLEFRLNMETRDTIVRVFQEDHEEMYRIKVDERVLGLLVDPNRWSLISLGSIEKYQDLDQMERGPFIIYPNPSGDFVRIDFLGNMEKKTIQILDLSGQLISEYSATGNFTELDTGHLSSGMYFIKVFVNHDTWVQKFIKK